MEPKFTNRLAGESSPYLLQHAHNPVDWYPWGTEALQRAKDEDKPILVSIGYAACHWCHVMEKESFENEEVAAFMNLHFVNIKVDREERPDVDHIYMDAVQAIAGSGGWPLNVFLLPDGKPFYGGTYYPPERAFNRASWREVLQAIATAYREGKEKLYRDAETLTEHLRQSNAIGGRGAGDGSRMFQPKRMEEALGKILKVADRDWGGFGKAPKFPQTFTLSFLLAYAKLTGNGEAEDHALLSLDKMIQGGLYDHLGGGFARYSTDREWLAPHFEKMLYDNALLVSTLSEAYALTGRQTYREVIEETLRFVERELLDGEGGFYSALDADSEGEEGKFYVWSHEEVTGSLGADAALFCAYYDISPEGNWEGKSILRVLKPLSLFAAERGIPEEEVRTVLQRGRETLFRIREGRVRPGLDDKVLLGWNALMNAAYSRAAAALGRDDYRQRAERNMAFLLEAFAGAEGWKHTWKGGKAKYPAFLDDLAYLTEALIRLAEVTGNDRWLQEAARLAETTISGFSDESDTLFYFTHRDQSDILLRKKEIQDGATPSGNSVMAGNLYRLGILFDRQDWRGRAERMLLTLGEPVIKYPTSFAVWLMALSEVTWGTSEVAIVGEEAFSKLKEVNRLFIPHKLIMAAIQANEYPLLNGKGEKGKTLIYLCRNYACKKPVCTTDELQGLLNPK